MLYVTVCESGSAAVSRPFFLSQCEHDIEIKSKEKPLNSNPNVLCAHELMNKGALIQTATM